MGKEMSKILPGVYVGRLDNAQNDNDMMANCITHVLSVHEPVKQKLIKWNSYTYFEVNVEDDDSAPISKYFSKTNYFIHEARVTNGNVLIHCLAGVSRAPTVVLAYLMTVYDLSLQDAFNCLRSIRPNIKPNNGFLRQLSEYEEIYKLYERERLFKEFGVWKDIEEDRKYMNDLIRQYQDQETANGFLNDSAESIISESLSSPIRLNYSLNPFDFDCSLYVDSDEDIDVPGSISIVAVRNDPITLLGALTTTTATTTTSSANYRGRAHSRTIGTTYITDNSTTTARNTISPSVSLSPDNIDK